MQALLLPTTFKPESRLPGLQGLWEGKRSGYTRAAGMAAQFNSASSRYFTNAGNAVLRGSINGWYRFGWFYHDSTTLAQDVIATDSGNTGIKVNTGALGANVILSVGNGSAVKTATFTITLSTATWYFWYAYYDGTNIGISINNGTVITTALAAAFSPGAQAFDVGAGIGGVVTFDGRMQCLGGDDVAGLTAAQVTSLYNAGTPLAYDQMPGAITQTTTFFFWELNEPSLNRVDLGLNAYVLTPTNTPGTAAGTCLNAVGQWNDLSGLGNHATQSTQTAKPYFRSRGVNGFPSIKKWEAANDAGTMWLKADGLSTFAAGQDKPLTGISVFRRATNNDGYVWIFSDKTVNSILMGLGYSSGGNFYVHRRDDVGTGDVTVLGSADAGTTPAVLTTVFSGTTVSYYKNSVVDFLDTAMNVNTMTVNSFTIGAWQESNVVIRGVDGDISFVMLVNRVVLRSEQVILERYIAREYGIKLAD